MNPDYVLRLIEQAGRMLGAILRRRKDGDAAGARHELEQAAQQHIGLPLAMLRRLSPDALANLLKSGGDRSHLRAFLLGELLVQEAEIAEEEARPQDALVSYVHAWRLWSDALAVLDGDERAHYGAKLTAVAKRLRSLGETLGIDLSTLIPPTAWAAGHGSPAA